MTGRHYGAGDAVQRVLDRLEAMGKVVKWIGNQHIAQCPGHDDGSPSLTVRDGDQGVVLYCQGGCDTRDVVTAMGLQMRDLFDSPMGGGPSGTLNRRDRHDAPSAAVLDGILPPWVRSGDPAEDRRPGTTSLPAHPVPASSSVAEGAQMQNPPAGSREGAPGTTPTGGFHIATTGEGETKDGAVSVAPGWVCDYIYADEHGEPAFKVARYATAEGGKEFRQNRREGSSWVAGLAGRKLPLYRLPQVRAAAAAGDWVWVVEGEKDADSLAALGYVATTSSGGAGKWQPEHTAALAGCWVAIVPDLDSAEKGYTGQRHAAAVYRALEGGAQAVQVYLPVQGCKDVSDHLAAGYGVDQLRPCTVEELEALWAPVEEGRLDLVCAAGVVIKRVRWGWQDRMPIGELTLIPGREGVGKSLLLAWLAAEVTKGTLPGEFHGTPRSVLYVASEDSWSYTVAPRMKAAGADLDRVFRIEAVDGGRVTLPSDCREIPRLAAQAGAAVLMLDPVLSLIHDRISVNQAQELRQALEPLRRATEDAEIMTLGLCHFNKTVDVDVLSKIPGSRAWAEVARAAFGVAEDREQECYVASQIKNNLGRVGLPNLSYRIESVTIDAEDGPTDVGRLVWIGESEVGIEEVLGRRPDKASRAVGDTAQELVAYVLECGRPLHVQEIYEHFPEMQRETVRKTLTRLADKGTLSNPLRGHYGPGTLP